MKTMGKRNRYHNHLDPEVQRWGNTYPHFLGVAECVRLIDAGKARGIWAEVIHQELAENAKEHLAEMIAVFHAHSGDFIALYMLMALETEKIPESVEFLAQVLRDGNEHFVPYARRALLAINTRESRKALYEIDHGAQGS